MEVGAGWDRGLYNFMPNIAVSTVHADGLTALCVRAFTGTTMTKFGNLIFTGPALEGQLKVNSKAMALWCRVGMFISVEYIPDYKTLGSAFGILRAIILHDL